MTDKSSEKRAGRPEERQSAWGNAVTEIAGKQRQTRMMRWLDWRWRDAYVCFSGDGEYSATRLDDLQVLTAGSAFELQLKIVADHHARPVVEPVMAVDE